MRKLGIVLAVVLVGGVGIWLITPPISRRSAARPRPGSNPTDGFAIEPRHLIGERLYALDGGADAVYNEATSPSPCAIRTGHLTICARTNGHWFCARTLPGQQHRLAKVHGAAGASSASG